MNSAAVRLPGWTREEATGRRLHELRAHSYPNGLPYPRDASPIEAALRDGRGRPGQVDVVWRKDGPVLPVRHAIRQATGDETPTGGILELTPASRAASTISLRRRENSRSTSVGIAASSAAPLTTGAHSSPKRSRTCARRAAWER
jgi:hypothetical protein